MTETQVYNNKDFTEYRHNLTTNFWKDMWTIRVIEGVEQQAEVPETNYTLEWITLMCLYFEISNLKLYCIALFQNRKNYK